MTKLLILLDRKTELVIILYLFWAIFWGLNGGDKFLNGQYVPQRPRGQQKA